MFRRTDELRFLKMSWAIGLAVLLWTVATGCATVAGPEYPASYGNLNPVPQDVWVPLWVDLVEQVDLYDQPTPAYPPHGVFYVPPATDLPFDGFECGHPFKCWGVYDNSRVYVVEGLLPATRDGVLQHEMLHHIIRGDGDHCSHLWADLDLANGTTCGSVSRGDHDSTTEG